MIIHWIAVVIGIVILVFSSTKLINYVMIIAKHFKISPMIIGLTMISIGTSIPEILVSFMASINQHQNLAIGNAIGSNITNLSLVLGLTILISPIFIKSEMLIKEIPMLLIASFVSGFCLWDKDLNKFDAYLLLFTTIFILFFFIFFDKTSIIESKKVTKQYDKFNYIIVLKFILSITTLVISSKLIIWGASSIAYTLDISEMVIGLTILALGTSLPELATAITSSLKGHDDIAIGSIFGSNIFNILMVLAIPGFISPTKLTHNFLIHDYMAMIIITIFVIFCCFVSHWNKSYKIGRLAGSVLVTTYFLYSYSLLL